MSTDNFQQKILLLCNVPTALEFLNQSIKTSDSLSIHNTVQYSNDNGAEKEKARKAQKGCQNKQELRTLLSLNLPI